jgi:hypothetical protein
MRVAVCGVADAKLPCIVLRFLRAWCAPLQPVDEDGYTQVRAHQPGRGASSSARAGARVDEVALVQQLLSAEAALTAWGQQQQQQQQQRLDEQEQQGGLLALQLAFGEAFCRLPRDIACAMTTSPVRQELLAAAAEALAARGGAGGVGSMASQPSVVGARLQTLLADLLQSAAELA